MQIISVNAIKELKNRSTCGILFEFLLLTTLSGLLLWIVYAAFLPNIKNLNLQNGHIIARTFEIDYKNDQFLMDGKPFRYYSGSFHYFRALPQRWRNKFRAMHAAGLNAVETLVKSKF